MFYVDHPSQASAVAASRSSALARGCSPTGETQYWWNVVVNPGTGKWALPIEDSGLYGSTPVSIVNAKDFGAVGDGIADDTAALQAAITAGFTKAVNVYVPTGTYKITAPLTIPDYNGSNNVAGWRVYGDGGKPDSASGPGGTIIRLFGTGPFASIMTVGSAAFRQCAFEDFGLECVTKGAAAYGLLFDSTEFSNNFVTRVQVSGVGTAFGILVGTGANGESIRFSGCYAQSVDKFFYINAGQAIVQSFDHCTCGLNAGGVYFHQDHTNGGGGLYVTDFNGTGTKYPSSNVTNTTLYLDNGNSSAVIFMGGRVEHVSCLYRNALGGSGIKSTPVFKAMEITSDANQGDANLTNKYFLDSNGPWGGIVSLENCMIEADLGVETIQMRTNNSSQPGARFISRACVWKGFPVDPQLLATAANAPATAGVIRFDDCITTA